MCVYNLWLMTYNLYTHINSSPSSLTLIKKILFFRDYSNHRVKESRIKDKMVFDGYRNLKGLVTSKEFRSSMN